MALANASTALVERTSSLAQFTAFNPLSLSVEISVAITLAPSAINASAMARPMPCPAAVTSASLFFNRLVTIASVVIPGAAQAAIRNPETHSLRGRRIPGSRFRAPRNDEILVVVARHGFLRDALIFNCGLEHHAVAQLIDYAPLDFL